MALRLTSTSVKIYCASNRSPRVIDSSRNGNGTWLCSVVNVSILKNLTCSSSPFEVKCLHFEANQEQHFVQIFVVCPIQPFMHFLSSPHCFGGQGGMLCNAERSVCVSV